MENFEKSTVTFFAQQIQSYRRMSGKYPIGGLICKSAGIFSRVGPTSTVLNQKHVRNMLHNLEFGRLLWYVIYDTYYCEKAFILLQFVCSLVLFLHICIRL